MSDASAPATTGEHAAPCPAAEGRAGRFTWLPEDLATHVEQALAGEMPRGRGTLSRRDAPAHLGEAEVDGKRHVVFVCYYAYPSTIKKSVALRRGGEHHTTLLACCIRDDLEIDSWFDEAYEVESYEELLSMLRCAAPSAVAACIQPSLLGAVVLEACPEVRVVVDVNDTNCFMRRDQGLVECRLERAVLGRANALTHKMPPAALDQLRAEWGLDVPDFLTHCLPMRELFEDSPPPPPPPFRIVYAGGIMPYHAAVRHGHEHMIMDPIITETAGKNLSLTFFANQNAREMHWEDQARYYDLQRTYPHFSFEKGVPFHRLPGRIAGYHLGLLYDQKAISSYRTEAYTYNMSTKIFSYFEAGLPLLVYDALEYICEFVERYGLGVIYRLDRLHELPSLLEQADLASLRRNVRAFRESNALETLLPTLRQVYGGGRP